MKEEKIVKASDEEMTLREFFVVLWGGRFYIAFTAFFFTIITAVYVLKSSDFYESQVFLAPASGGLELNLYGNQGRLASVSNTDEDTQLALAILQSRRFIMTFIQKYGLLVPLMAADSWDYASNELSLDNDIYNVDSKQWVRDVSPPYAAEPSLLEAYEKFSLQFKVQHDKKNDTVILTFEHYSPVLAQKWLHLLVADLNQHMRSMKVCEITRSIEALKNQLEKSEFSDIRINIYGLIEEQEKNLAIKNMRKEYAFTVIDDAYLPLKKVGPHRYLLLILSAILGVLISATYVLFVHVSCYSSDRFHYASR